MRKRRRSLARLARMTLYPIIGAHLIGGHLRYLNSNLWLGGLAGRLRSPYSRVGHLLESQNKKRATQRVTLSYLEAWR